MVVVVLGVHRGGTSCVAGMLHHLGVSMGRRLMGATENNPRGHFEDEDFVALHRRILGETGPLANQVARWRDPRPDPDACRADYRRLVVARAQGGADWGLKDPRLCYTLPALLDALDGVPARFVRVHRPWRESAASLHARESKTDPAFDLAAAERVARRYHEQLARVLPTATARGPVLSLEFAWVVGHAAAAARVLAGFAGLDNWTIEGQGGRLQAAVALVDPALKHWSLP